MVFRQSNRCHWTPQRPAEITQTSAVGQTGPPPHKTIVVQRRQTNLVTVVSEACEIRFYYLPVGGRSTPMPGYYLRDWTEVKRPRMSQILEEEKHRCTFRHWLERFQHRGFDLSNLSARRGSAFCCVAEEQVEESHFVCELISRPY